MCCPRSYRTHCGTTRGCGDRPVWFEPSVRTGKRSGTRNGLRPRPELASAEDVEVRVPRRRKGWSLPDLIESRRKDGRTLWSVIMTAYVSSTSTRRIDDRVKSSCCESKVSQLTVSPIRDDIHQYSPVPRQHYAVHAVFRSHSGVRPT